MSVRVRIRIHQDDFEYGGFEVNVSSVDTVHRLKMEIIERGHGGSLMAGDFDVYVRVSDKSEKEGKEGKERRETVKVLKEGVKLRDPFMTMETVVRMAGKEEKDGEVKVYYRMKSRREEDAKEKEKEKEKDEEVAEYYVWGMSRSSDSACPLLNI